jgi:cobalamin biosynthesis protein CobT
MKELEKVARTIGRNNDLELIFAGTQAKTDNKKIILPQLPAELTDDQVLKLRALCDHEVGHVLYSSFDLLKDPRFQRLPNHTKDLTNLIEDIRIEKLHGDDYYGVKKNLEDFTNAEAPDADTDHPFGKLWVEGRRYCCGMDIDVPDTSEELKAHWGEDLFDKISNLKSSEEAMELAIELMEDKEEDMPEPPGGDGEEGDPEGEGGEGESGEGDKEKDGEGKGGGSGDDEDDSDDSDSDKGSSGDSDVNKGDDELSVDTPEGSGENSEKPWEGDQKAFKEKAKQSFKSPTDGVKELFEAMSEEEGDSGYLPFTTAYDRIIPLDEDSNLSGFDYLKKQLGPLNVARSKIVSVFQAKTASRWSGGFDHGKVNPRALASVHTGRSDVFKQKTISRAKDTAITFLLDFSGSMSGSKFECAMMAAVLFMETLQGANVKYEVLGFTTGDHVAYHDRDLWDSQNPSMAGKWGRVEALDTYVVKDFEENYGAKIKRRVASYERAYLANNCDGESVMVAYERLMKRPERRKIMFVLSDGQPASAGNNRKGNAYLKEVTKFIETKSPVELMGIGLLSRSVENFYSNNIVVTRQNDLVKTISSNLSKFLQV